MRQRNWLGEDVTPSTILSHTVSSCKHTCTEEMERCNQINLIARYPSLQAIKISQDVDETNKKE